MLLASCVIILHFFISLDVPTFWDDQSVSEELKVVPIDPEKDEFRRVSMLFLQSMPRCAIRHIERIQNKPLWRKYCDRAKQMFEYDQTLGEKTLFHGTSSHKPKEVFEGDSSFDMRYSREGAWGKGNYFAVNALYSSRYAYREGGVCQMLMAYVLTGHSILCESDRTLRKPPYRGSQEISDDNTIRRRYDSVCGLSGGSKVFITYDNDKAYPAYLISYVEQ